MQAGDIYFMKETREGLQTWNKEDLKSKVQKMRESWVQQLVAQRGHVGLGSLEGLNWP